MDEPADRTSSEMLRGVGQSGPSTAIQQARCQKEGSDCANGLRDDSVATPGGASVQGQRSADARPWELGARRRTLHLRVCPRPSYGGPALSKRGISPSMSRLWLYGPGFSNQLKITLALQLESIPRRGRGTSFIQGLVTPPSLSSQSSEWRSRARRTS